MALVLREKPSAPLRHVRVTEHVRGNKWKAEWIEPKAGLTDYEVVAPDCSVERAEGVAEGLQV